MLEKLLAPPAIQDYPDYFKTVLSISGVLLGLAFTALIFVIQNGFNSFKFSRRMFLELYALFGRHLLIGLSYLTLISIGMLYLGAHRGLLSFGYYWFCLMFTRSFLDYHKHRGYIHTLFSTKFVPARYGRIRRYFRYIRNLGPLSVLALLTYLLLFTLYPVAISFREGGTFILTTKGFFYSTLLLLGYSVLRIAGFITEFFALSNKEIEAKAQAEGDTPPGQGNVVDYAKEKRALREYLLAHGVEELRPQEEALFLDGTITVGLLEQAGNAEAWFNIAVEVENSTVFEIRDAVCGYAFKLFTLLHNSMVDLNSFVLSFHIRIDGEGRTRNIFFRSNRLELDRILAAPADPRSAVMRIENKLFDDLFRDLAPGGASPPAPRTADHASSGTTHRSTSPTPSKPFLR